MCRGTKQFRGNRILEGQPDVRFSIIATFAYALENHQTVTEHPNINVYILAGNELLPQHIYIYIRVLLLLSQYQLRDRLGAVSRASFIFYAAKMRGKTNILHIQNSRVLLQRLFHAMRSVFRRVTSQETVLVKTASAAASIRYVHVVRPETVVAIHCTAMCLPKTTWKLIFEKSTPARPFSSIALFGTYHYMPNTLETRLDGDKSSIQ